MAEWKAMPPRRPSILATFLGKITRHLSIDRWRSRNRYKRGGGEIILALEELEDCVADNQTVEKAFERKQLAIDGNGVDDLLIGRDGYCTDIFWEVDGKTERRSMDGAIYYLCEDQVISFVLMPGSTNYFFTRLDNGTIQGIANINYVPGHPEGEYRKYSMETWNV